ncbi:MAG: D-2-hydroxyacid dehydrogenase [Fidelibacterota bacterium]|nr:MAG: D-2-hydroxyacid dehydrogenase [Candidatus Neomarinimicrobiota bacterium]
MWNDDRQELRVLLVTRVSGLEEELRSRDLQGIELLRTKKDADTVRALAEAEVLVADPVLVASHLDAGVKLRWLQSTYAGVDSLFRSGTRRDYMLTRVKGVFGPLMAEYTLGHILARERYFLKLARQQENHQWAPKRYRRLSDLTLGILGCGDIGSAVAQAARTFGMEVWGLRKHPNPAAAFDKVYTAEQLADFLAGSDYLVNILPSTPATRGFLSGEVLKACRDTAVFINIGRGDVIDEASLVKAVQHSWIAGAILDVFGEEPLAPGSPLWDLPGVTITPHVAALGFAGDIADIIEANLGHYQAGEPLKHRVDWERGY